MTLDIYSSTNPELIIRNRQVELLAGTELNNAFAIRFGFQQYYLAPPQDIDLIAVVYLEKTNTTVNLSAAIFQFDRDLQTKINNLDGHIQTLKNFASQYQKPWLNLSIPLMLDPIKIPKPWGQEIWYTGIEARGQANIIDQGFTVPLPWVLALMPGYLANGLDKKIILLKTLDPLPDELYGDLYFELHEKKQEVYIVTQVDERAWQNQTGAIRMGFNKSKQAEFANNNDFKAAYLNAVKDYEKVRRHIDGLLDVEKQHNNIALDAPVDAETLTLWSKKIPPDIIRNEEKLRHSMNSFTQIHPLTIGDVIKIPCFVPHALQHGVRTVEFQTPVYERKILSFAQKVLTQQHWDTEAALEKSLFVTPVQEAHQILFDNGNVLVEEIVTFDDFRVLRIRLAAGASYQLPPQESYGLLMAINNSCCLVLGSTNITIAAEQSAFLPYDLMSSIDSTIDIHAGTVATQVLLATAI